MIMNFCNIQPNATQLPYECMSMSGELVSIDLNFCEQHKIFEEYSCHVSQIFST